MSSEAYKLYAGWRGRSESTHSCGVRLARTPQAFAEMHSGFSHWNKQADSRSAADQPAWVMPPKIDQLTEVFERGRACKDAPRELWPELGYSISAWNGQDPPRGASPGVRAGGYSTHIPFPNSVDLELNPASPGNADFACAAVLKQALLSIVAAWEPDYGSVICWDYWQRLFGERHYPPFRSGWMTYLAPPYASLMTPPPAAVVEPVPGGGLLLLATEERFSMDDPAHLAAADAIQAALDPVQQQAPPSRNEELRPGSAS
jgi:hypothetical protein